MKGTIVNVIAVVAGSLVGLFFARFVTERIRQVIMQGLGLSVMLIGISMALQTNNLLIVAGSMVLGGILGEVLDIEGWLDRMGERLKKRFRSKSGTFVTGFVTASLVYCVGAMAVVGSLEEGIRNDPSILYAKSLLDGFASIAFASALGVGVIFSIIPIFVYQGALTFLGMYLERFLTDSVIAELSATGGLLILGIGINLIFSNNGGNAAPAPKDGDTDVEMSRLSDTEGFGRAPIKIKVGNLLPALVFAALIALLVETFST
ncbi:MAG: DUF554 domain-containing protein [Deltaproteobacteria bacterium]|nr:DUF554 domain-containing protein [Candidatus Zymogenaceae bacterium]